MDKTTALMKRCQIGDSRWPDKVNNLLAECYGRLGALQEQNAALVETLKNLIEDYQRHGHGIATAALIDKAEEVIARAESAEGDND